MKTTNQQEKHTDARQKARLTRFDRTRLGRLMKAAAPIEYALVTQATRGEMPSDVLIERIGYASLCTLFRTQAFRSALIEYRRGSTAPALTNVHPA